MNHREVESHYTVTETTERILDALRDSGADVDALTVEDLAPVDEFHIRGRESTEQLVSLIEESGPVDRLLDVGCGLGGSCRFLAQRLDCTAVGVDLTASYCQTASALSERIGLDDCTEFRQASALALPFPDASFDLAWTEHVQMNIEDKARFYGEMARVIRPGGRLAFHDIFAGPSQPLHFPVPWAEDASISFLAEPESIRRALSEGGLDELHWVDVTTPSADWFRATLARVQESGPPPVGIHLLMGDTARDKLENITKNLAEDRLRVVMAVLAKPA